DGLTLKLGPRLFVGDESYAATYFGVTPAESVASGLAAFAPSGGALSAGVELGATYALNDRWNLYGGMRYDRLLNDAAGSPITGLGSADQFSINLGLTRRFVLNF
ncbi:MAG: MipA/OmpV family protein, partial [Rhodobacter sp.]|nr:MipA/OmpV family protein [Rhodobacter sp.]